MQLLLMVLLWTLSVLPQPDVPGGERSAFRMPSKLISFTGKVERENNLLQWQTVSEKGVREFIIETSGDGRAFELTAWIDPKGINDGPAVYTFKHQPSSDKTYYRLRMVQSDGKEQVSSVIVLSRTSIR